MDFWFNGKLALQIRSTEDKISKPCKKCKFLDNCRGCRAICYNKYGDFFSGEKDCFAYKEEIK